MYFDIIFSLKTYFFVCNNALFFLFYLFKVTSYKYAVFIIGNWDSNDALDSSEKSFLQTKICPFFYITAFPAKLGENALVYALNVR